MAEETDNVQKSFPLWESLVRANSNYTSFFTNVSHLIYANTDELISKTTNELGSMASSDYALIIGIATTDQAMALSKCFELNVIKNTNVMFLSPLVTGNRSSFNALPFIRASLSDETRIKKLMELRPEEWKSMNAASIVTSDAFGLQLNNLLKNTNLCRLLDPAMFTTNLDLPGFAGKCFERRTPLIFAALQTGSIRELLKELKSHATFLTPYKPIVCFLQEYDFDKTNRVDAIPNEYRNDFTIMIASSAKTTADLSHVVDRLDDDLFYILDFLYNTSEKKPEQFALLVNKFFSGNCASTDWGNKMQFTNSQYFYSLLSWDRTPMALKWLPGQDARGVSTWPLPLETFGRGNSVAFNRNMLGARVPWTVNLYLVAICWILLIVGIIMEIRKRYIFVRKRFIDLAWRIIAWLVIATVFLGLLVSLCYYGTVPSDNLVLLLGLCLTPLSILPMLQSLGFTKIPLLNQIVDWPSQKFETVMDRLINTSGTRDLTSFRTEIGTAIANEKEKTTPNQDPNNFDVEKFLWTWWFGSLRTIKGEKNARKIFDRFSPAIQAWNNERNSETRIVYLTNALAFTSMIYNAQSGDV